MEPVGRSTPPPIATAALVKERSLCGHREIALWPQRDLSVATDRSPCGHREISPWPQRDLFVATERSLCGHREISPPRWFHLVSFSPVVQSCSNALWRPQWTVSVPSFVYQSVVQPSICSSFHVSATRMSVCPSLHPSIHRFVRLSVVRPSSGCLFVRNRASQ